MSNESVNSNVPSGSSVECRLKERYIKEIAPAMMAKFKYRSVMEIPKLEKIVLSSGVGEAVQNSKAMDFVKYAMTQISGQKPVVTKSKKSIAGFKLREGVPIGCMVTLRQQRMYDLLDRLISVALPRVRDFRGISPKGFDGRGNFCFGLKEQIVFPEIEHDKLDKIRGMDICFVTSAKTDEEGRELLRLFGMPFRTQGGQANQ